MSTKRFYDENGNRPVHETRTLSRMEVYQKLYAKGGSGRLSDQPFISTYGPRRIQAIQRNNYTEAARLDAESAELERLAVENKFDDRQTLRLATVSRDVSKKPLMGDQVPTRDSYRLREKFGTRVGLDYIDVDAAARPALDHFLSKLKDKPVLKAAFEQGNAKFHADVVETAIELAISEGIVKPITQGAA